MDRRRPGTGSQGWGGIQASAPCRTPTGRSLTMLWTILVILVIVALVVFILGRARGGRRGL